MTPLRACPFCQSPELQVDQTMGHYAVLCIRCGAFGPDATSKGSAMERWNRRPVISEVHHA